MGAYFGGGVLNKQALGIMESKMVFSKGDMIFMLEMVSNQMNLITSTAQLNSSVMYTTLGSTEFT